ncbi:MAG: hypothetical protein MUC34_15605 [Anaerolineae bacterium]|jgi:hypothetical protein|nr:hypothetical protein [Anaerolineae bacterium]
MAATLTFAGPPGAIDELGVWTPLGSAALEAFTPREFALAEDAAATPAETMLWQQDLAGFETAELASAEGRLAVAATALPQAETRAAIFAAGSGTVAGVAAEFAGPERNLAEWARLAPINADELTRRPDFRAAAEQVAAFFAKVREAVRNYTRVVTRIDGAAVAVTEVGWTGHFSAAWAPGLPVDQAARHTAAVTLALRTRDLWLRLAATVLSGAVRLAALFAANPLLALPAAYRFARQVIEQAQALNLLPQGGSHA